MIPDVRIRFEFNGDDRVLSFVEVPLAAWSELRQSVGLTPKKLMEGLADRSDVDALVAVVWLERVQSKSDPGRFVPFRDRLSGSDVLVLQALQRGEQVLFGEFGGGDEDPPTSGTG